MSAAQDIADAEAFKPCVLSAYGRRPLLVYLRLRREVQYVSVLQDYPRTLKGTP